MRNISQLLTLTICLLFSAACTTLPLPVNGGLLTEDSTTSTAAVESVVSTPIVPTLAPSPTVAITIEPTEVGVQACLEQAPVPPLIRGDFKDYPEKIKVFLNLGGAAPELARSLYDLELAFASDPHVPVRLAELTGDDRSDVVISIHNPAKAGNPPQGALLIYTCWEGQLLFTHYEPSVPGLSTPAIIHVQDINADGLNELIISSLQVGAHSTFEFMQILSWDGENFVNHLADITGDLPFPEIQITDFDADGIYDLEITSTGYGSVGAGPQRQVIRSWVYQPASGDWERATDTLGFSPYRIHTLHDADDALNRGEIDIALLLYGLVVSDDNLQDWIDPQAERLNLGAYARLKMVIVNAIKGDLEAAQGILGVMEGQYPDFMVQHAYTEMARLFLDAQPVVGTAQACQALQAYTQAHLDEVLYPLGADAEQFPQGGSPFGYANARYTPEAICP